MINPYIFQPYIILRYIFEFREKNPDDVEYITIVHDFNEDNAKEYANLEIVKDLLDEYVKLPIKFVSIFRDERIEFNKSFVFYLISQKWNIKKDFRDEYSKTFPFNFNYYDNVGVEKEYKRMENFFIVQYNESYPIENFVKLLIANIYRVFYKGYRSNHLKAYDKVFKKREQKNDVKYRGMNYYGFIILNPNLSLKEKFLLHLFYNGFLFLKKKFNRWYSVSELKKILYEYSKNQLFRNESKKNYFTKEVLDELVKKGYLEKSVRYIGYTDKKQIEYRILSIPKVVKKFGIESLNYWFSYATRYFMEYPYKYYEFEDNVIMWLLEQPSKDNAFSKKYIRKYTGLTNSALARRLRQGNFSLVYRFLEIDNDEFLDGKYENSSDLEEGMKWFTILANEKFKSYTRMLGVGRISKSYWFNIVVYKKDNNYKYQKMFFNDEWKVLRYNRFKFFTLEYLSKYSMQNDLGMLKSFTTSNLAMDNLKTGKVPNRDKDLEMLHRNVHSQLLTPSTSLKKYKKHGIIPVNAIVYSVYSKKFFKSFGFLKKIVYAIKQLQLSSYLYKEKKRFTLRELMTPFVIFDLLKKMKFNELKKRKIFTFNKRKLLIDMFKKIFGMNESIIKKYYSNLREIYNTMFKKKSFAFVYKGILDFDKIHIKSKLFWIQKFNIKTKKFFKVPEVWIRLENLVNYRFFSFTGFAKVRNQFFNEFTLRELNKIFRKKQEIQEFVSEFLLQYEMYKFNKRFKRCLRNVY